MNVATSNLPVSTTHLMMAEAYRESLGDLKPVVYLNGLQVNAVANEPNLQPGIQALGVTYDFVHRPALAPLMLARNIDGRYVPRMRTSTSLWAIC